MSKKHGRSGLTVVMTLWLAACAGVPLSDRLGEKSILDQFRRIHTRVYDVYSLGNADGAPDRDRIHELLASSFSGDALTDEYVEHFTTLAQMTKEATAIHVLAVDYEKLQIASSTPDEVEVLADWSVGGIVSHQLHRHHRVNRYQASYTLAPTSDGSADLRIVSSHVRNAERIRNPLDGTGAFPLDDLPTSSRGLVGPAELLREGILDDTEPAATAPPPASPPQR